MEKNKQAELETSNENQESKITPDIAKSIEDLIYQQKNIERDKEALKEALDAVAEKLGIKAGELSSRIRMIIKEEEKGGEIKSKTQQIDFVEEYFTVKSNNEFK